ncbi:hypothetical protein [Brevundimonas sp.]|jgi:hypothetical protein|uniref:hypothetical protein n=1 Tax=Brevundimonas sp. TaxID=1871086 RepID=UPI00378352A0
MISTAALAALVLAMQAPAWTWTLYEGSGPIVLANERPDTPDLRTTLECSAGSGIARVSVYQSTLKPGFATVTSGDQSATTEAGPGADQAVVASLRTDHPVFGRFSASGTLSMTVGEARQVIQIDAGDLAKLRRFADLCGG